MIIFNDLSFFFLLPFLVECRVCNVTVNILFFLLVAWVNDKQSLYLPLEKKNLFGNAYRCLSDFFHKVFMVFGAPY